MREIEFRGKRVDNGEWVYGYLVVYIEGSESCELHTHFIFNEKRNGYSEAVEQEKTYCVDPSTVGQYTGLKDKNGVKIYEGDILRMWRSVGMKGELRGKYKPLPVVYCDLWCQFVALDDSNKLQYGIWEQFGAFEVIGNIHDNPELLEG